MPAFAKGSRPVSAGLDRYRPSLLLLARALLAGQRLLDRDAVGLVGDVLEQARRDDRPDADEDERFARLRKLLLHHFLDACARARADKLDVSTKTLEADLTGSFAGLDGLLVGPDTSPASRAARNDRFHRLAAALERLDCDGQRQAVTLRHFAGFRLREIAQSMRLTPVAVAGLLMLGRRNLEGLLGETT